MSKTPVALQLYTVRDLTAKDFAGTMKQVGKLGFEGVELAGYGNLSTARDARRAIDDAGLKVAGAHVALASLEEDVNKALDDQQTLGNTMVIVPWLPKERFGSAAGWRNVAESLMTIARECQKRRMTLAYHNHAFEFDKHDGKTGFDIIWEHTDAKLVKAEFDVFWIKYAGHDPVEYIDEHADRVVMLHMKDMAAGAEKKFAAVGTGIIDIPAIAAAGQKLGVKWFVVEQDDCYGAPPLDIARTGLENLRKMGVV